MSINNMFKFITFALLVFVSGNLFACSGNDAPTALIYRSETKIKADSSATTYPAYHTDGVIYVTVGQEVTFYGYASDDNTGYSQLECVWDFGDGQSTDEIGPLYPDSNGNLEYDKIYTSAGAYTVTLTVDDGLLTSTAEQLVCVEHSKVTRIEKKSGSDDEIWYSQIQYAIEMSNIDDQGVAYTTYVDELIVASGVHYENIDFEGKDIKLRSEENLASETTINGNGLSPVVTFSGYETSASSLSGFTITSELDSRLVGYWKLDGDSSYIAHDDTDNGNDGIIMEYDSLDPQPLTSPAWDSDGGILGGCLGLNGTDEYIEIDGYHGISGAQARTCCAWIKTEDTDGGVIMVWGTASSPGERWRFEVLPTGTLKIGTGDGNVTGSTAVNDGIWHHVAVTLENDGSTNISEAMLYVDGVYDVGSITVGSNGGGVITTSDSNVLIGKLFSDAYYFSGYMDDVRIYNEALSPYEIALFSKCSDSGLVAYWKLDSVESGTSYTTPDYFGNHNGNLYGGLETGLSGSGKIGNCFDFDGDDDLVGCGANYEEFETYTLSAWVNISGSQTAWTSHGGWVIGKEGDYQGFGLAVGTTEPAVYHSNGSTYTRLESNTNLTLNQWHHIAGTYDGEVVSIYVDGVCENYTTASGFENNLTKSLMIGSWSWGGSRAFDGMIDDVRLYNYAMSSDQIDGLYDSANDSEYVYYPNGGGILGNGACATIGNCIITGNSALNGGGIANCDGTILNCIVKDNTSDYGGGLYGCNGSIKNCVVCANTAGYNGAGLYACDASIINCTVFANEAGGATGGMMFEDYQSPVVTNCIIWGNTDVDSSTTVQQAQINLDDTFAGVTYSCIQDDESDTTVPFGGITYGNIDTSPCFLNVVDLDGEDDVFGTSDDGLMIEPGSPCIDSGSGSAVDADMVVDMAGLDRIVDFAHVVNTGAGTEPYVDMGAYEFNPLYYSADGVVYVAYGSPDTSKDGTCWARAFTNIQAGVTAAASDTELEEVWVAGNVDGNDDGDLEDSEDIDRTYVLSSQIDVDYAIGLYGGFNTSESARDQRDFREYQVIVDGNESVRGFYVSDDAVIDGFTVKDCRCTANYNGNGGAGLLIDGCSPTIASCVFIGNISSGDYGQGGGISVQHSSSSPTIQNCIFYNNRALWRGGGISTFGNFGHRLDSVASLTLTNCVFVGNTCQGPQNSTIIGGGAFASYSTDSTIKNCTFYNNTANRGGAILCETEVSSIDIEMYNSIFWDNKLYYTTSGGYEFYVEQSRLELTGGLYFYDCDVDRHIFGDSEHWYSNFSSPDGSYHDLTNTINADPCFLSPNDPDGSDNKWMTSLDGLMIQSIYCIDGGTDDYVDGTIYMVETDITGADRIYDLNDPTSHVDIGAYEYYPNP